MISVAIILSGQFEIRESIDNACIDRLEQSREIRLSKAQKPGEEWVEYVDNSGERIKIDKHNANSYRGATKTLVYRDTRDANSGQADLERKPGQKCRVKTAPRCTQMETEEKLKGWKQFTDNL